MHHHFAANLPAQPLRATGVIEMAMGQQQAGAAGRGNAGRLDVGEDQVDGLDEFRSGISREAQIFDEGFKAGIAGKSTSDGPHDANTEAGQTWLAGWHLGQSRNVAGIGKTTTDSLGTIN